MLAVGLWIYVRHTQSRNRTGQFGLWGLAAFQVITYLGVVFGPPPTSVPALAWSGQLLYLILIGLGYWVDANREVAKKVMKESATLF